MSNFHPGGFVNKWILLFVAVLVFSISENFAQAQQTYQDLPLPLPNEPGQPGQPGQPQPSPEQPPQPPSGTPLRYTLGSASLSRFKEGEFSFYPRADLNKLARLSLTAGGNNIVIKEVRIQYADYFDERLDYILPGDLKSGNTRTSTMSNRPVYKITVKASAAYFWKKPGNFRVDAAAYR